MRPVWACRRRRTRRRRRLDEQLQRAVIVGPRDGRVVAPARGPVRERHRRGHVLADRRAGGGERGGEVKAERQHRRRRPPRRGAIGGEEAALGQAQRHGRAGRQRGRPLHAVGRRGARAGDATEDGAVEEGAPAEAVAAKEAAGDLARRKKAADGLAGAGGEDLGRLGKRQAAHACSRQSGVKHREDAGRKEKQTPIGG